MSMPKKTLSIFLSIIMLITSLSVGLYGYAAELEEDQLYDELAARLQNNYVANRANYSVEHIRDASFEGWVEELNLYKTLHIVHAKDNKDGSIYFAAQKFYEVFEHEVSYVYGEGSYDSQLLLDIVMSKLGTRITAENLETYNIRIVLDYFLGSSTVINSGNWFHEYVFSSKTDIDSALLDVSSVDEIIDAWINIYELTISYALKREFDMGTGTKPQYSFDEVSETHSITPDTDTVFALRDASAFFRNDNVVIWNQEPFSKMTEAQLAAWRNSGTGQEFMRHYNTLSQYSTQVIFNLFGARIGDIMHLHGNTQPISQTPFRDEVRKNPDGSSVSYDANVSRLNDMVYNIDSIITDDRLNSVMPLLVDSLLGDFEGDIVPFNNINKLLQQLVKDMLYSDDIINALFELLYPALADALYTLKFDLLGGTIDLGDSAMMERILNNNQIRLSPKLFSTNVLTGENAEKYPLVKAELDRANLAATSDKIAWEEVDWDNMVWGIDSRESFLDVFSLVFGGLGRLFRTLFFGEDRGSGRRVSLALTGDTTVAYIYGRDTYQNIIIPLFEALGVQNIYTHDGLKDMGAYDAAKRMFEPLFDWVEGTFLPNPIETVCHILPNLVLYLDKDTPYSPYKLLTNTNNEAFSLNFPAQLLLGDPVYTLEVGDFLDDDIKNALSGINAALKEFVSLDADMPLFDSNGEPVMVVDPETGESEQDTYEVEVSLPYLMEKKLRSCGIEESYTSLAKRLPGTVGYRVRVENPGYVLLYLLRFVFSSLMQRTYTQGAGFSEASLANALGLDMDDEILDGVTTGGLVTNIVFNYDDAICALLELFSANEDGYEYDHRKTPTSKEYAYQIKEVDYHNDLLLGRISKRFGPSVRYTESWTRSNANYVYHNLDELLSNVFKMLKLEDADNLNELLGNLISENLYTNEMLSSLADTLYGDEGVLSNLNDLIGDEDDEVSLDLYTLLKDLLGVELDPKETGTMLGKRIFGDDVRHSEVSLQMRNAPVENKWSSSFFYKTNAEGEQVARDWGFENHEINKNLGGSGVYSESEILAMNIGALLSPLAFAFRFLFADEDIEVLDLVSVSGYAGYQYSMIHLYEMLGVNRSDIATYKDYYEAAYDPATGDLNTIEMVVSPILKLVDKVIANPLDTIFELIPNIFFISYTGGINDILNNLLHPAYVLIDILSPIIDVKPMLESLFSDLDVGGVPLNLTLPLDVDMNILLNGLIGGGLSEALTFEVDGSELTLHLPYMDIASFCTGSVSAYNSVAGYETVRLNSSKADLLTLLARYIIETMFMPENRVSVKNFIVDWRALDDLDADTIISIFDYIAGFAEDYNFEDIALQILFMFFDKVLPISTDIADRFTRLDFSITDLLSAIGTDAFSDMLSQLMNASDVPNPTLSGFAKIIEVLREFFDKISSFFKQMFGG